MRMRTLRIIQFAAIAVWGVMLVLVWFGPAGWALVALLVQAVAMVAFFVTLVWSLYKVFPVPRRDDEGRRRSSHE